MLQESVEAFGGGLSGVEETQKEFPDGYDEAGQGHTKAENDKDDQPPNNQRLQRHHQDVAKAKDDEEKHEK